MKGMAYRSSAVVATLVVGAALAAAPPPPSAWIPPPQGAVAMFRQMPRAFAVGGGGAGGVAPRSAPPTMPGEPDVAVIHIAPIAFWDDAEGPGQRKLSEGTIRFYREGDERPLLTAAAGQPVPLPPGRWWLMAEARGYASTASARLNTAGGGAAELLELVTGVVPACRVRLSERADWQAVRRLDVVSVPESTVYPLHPDAERERWVAAGQLVVYAYGASGSVGAIGRHAGCSAGETVTVDPPQAPGPGRADLLVTFEWPRTAPQRDRDALRVTLRPAAEGGDAAAVEATPIWRGRQGAAFFVGVDAELPHVLRFEPPARAPVEHPVPPGGGTKRIDLDRLALGG
jgi:hypothetical protein